MKISNKSIANLLRDYADTLEVFAENPYRLRAYRRAARTIMKLDKKIFQLVKEGFDLTTLPNIGPGIARQIQEIIKTHKLPEIIKFKNKNKPFRNELLQISGLGKKRIALLKEVGVNSITKLKKGIANGFLQSEFTWMSKTLQKKLLASIEYPKKYEKFLKYKTAALIINYIQEQLRLIPDIIEAIPAGDYRRKAELVGNIDWVIHARNVKNITQKISELDIVKEIVSRDESSLSVILHSSLLMNFHVIAKESVGAALLFFTGSNEHIQALQDYLNNKQINLPLNNLMKNKSIAEYSETEIYQHIGLSYIEPELRENRGEILAAERNTLPTLITLNDIKGDLHSHTNETDGVEALEVMVEAAMQLRYEYFAITDHSKRLAITNGLDEKRLLKQIEQINKLNSKYPHFKILKSIEVDILEDGSLDLSDDVLKELDIRVCSIHSKFKLPTDKQTERIIRAMDNPYFNILGHMTGRLLTSRKPYDLQIEKIFIAAKERGCFIELNSQPARLDIHDVYCKQAKEIGLKVSISSDAHSVRELSFMSFGVNQARRGWLEKGDVINTRNVSELLKIIKRD